MRYGFPDLIFNTKLMNQKKNVCLNFLNHIIIRYVNAKKPIASMLSRIISNHTELYLLIWHLRIIIQNYTNWRYDPINDETNIHQTKNI